MSKERILIIEDEMDLLDLIDFNLTRRGFVTQCAIDGRDGLEKIGTFDPEVIILDLMLPEVNGWEICAELKKRKIDIPVVMLTAKSMPEDKVRGLEAGAADYMTKPFSMKELIIRVDKLLEKKRTREAQDMVFHEVANRITTIGCYSNLLSRNNDASPDAARYINTINHQVACANETISELKALTEVESGRRGLQNEKCDVPGILRQAADCCKAAAKLKSIKITLTGAQLAPAVNADSSALKHIFLNLIGNAVKYSAEGGSVEAAVSSEPKGLKVSIKDEGIGIPQEDLSLIFKNGFRAGNVKGVSGSGIGLYVVKKLVDAMGAQLEVRSVLGRGSEFTILFPARRQPISSVTQV
jgi:two-component system, sensor histidine kinase and response regulator